ncbi:hypothetical protein GS942_16445 [Rhodococcus hoagii]|nr:hypothetical protein [Prescottella equi]
MLDYQYSAVARYPKRWNLTFASVDPAPGRRWSRTSPGPVQIAGAFYCPATLEYTRKYGVPTTRRLLADKDFALHDERLRRILPF